jgi:hypothetical protein
VRTSIGFALGTLFSLGIVMSANAAGTTVAAPAKMAAQADVEVIVVTAKRPAVDATIEEIVVTAKRPSPSTVTAERTPPAMAIELPKLELAISDQPVFRL